MGIDVPEFLAGLGVAKDATETVNAVGDCTVIAFYYLLRVGEYTVKKQRNETKQTVQFKLEDAIFFRQDAKGHLRQLPINSLEKNIFFTEGMSTATNKYFKFVNIAGGAYSELVDVIRTTVVSDYQSATE